MKAKLTRRNLLFGLRERSVPSAATHGAPAAPVRLVAQIQPYDCLAQRGQICTVCAERCPVPGAVASEAGRVRIVASACTGCGICRDVCPAPQNAIVLWPAPSMPASKP